MKKNKLIIVLLVILLVILTIIIKLGMQIKEKQVFKKPPFDESAIEKELDDSNRDDLIDIQEGYSFYINATPNIVDNKLLVDFYSDKENLIWIKVRLLDSNSKKIGESGLLKPGEYVKYVKLNKKLKNKDKITYEIMGYEMDTYFSAGTVKLNTEVGG